MPPLLRAPLTSNTVSVCPCCSVACRRDARALNNLTNDMDFAFFQLVIDDDFGPRRIDPFIRSVVALAVQYADKYEADRALFKAAYQAGNICKPASDAAGRRFRRSMRSVTRALRMAEHPTQ